MKRRKTPKEVAAWNDYTIAIPVHLEWTGDLAGAIPKIVFCYLASSCEDGNPELSLFLELKGMDFGERVIFEPELSLEDLLKKLELESTKNLLSQVSVLQVFEKSSQKHVTLCHAFHVLVWQKLHPSIKVECVRVGASIEFTLEILGFKTSRTLSIEEFIRMFTVENALTRTQIKLISALQQ